MVISASSILWVGPLMIIMLIKPSSMFAYKCGFNYVEKDFKTFIFIFHIPRPIAK
jgi:ABC-type multidrug transport system permease subunit